MKKNKRKTVSLIVLNYNGKQHLGEYFESVYRQTLIPDEVIMMDNLSTDGSREFVKTNFPQVKIVADDSRNLGTATASNVGFAHTKGNYVIFQSNDMRLDKKCIEELVNTMEKDKAIGICTSVLVNYYKDEKSGKHLIDNAGGIADIYGFGMQKYPQKRIEDIPNQEEVFFSYGGSFIIKRTLYKKISGFDDRYFNLNEDFDLSWRVRLLGCKIVYNKKSIIYHKVSATLGPLYKRSLKRYWSEKNILRSLLKNCQPNRLLTSLSGYFFLLGGEMMYFLFRGRIGLFLADFKALLWNLYQLPNTLSERRKIQSLRQKNNIDDLLIKYSLKLKLFESFKKLI